MSKTDELMEDLERKAKEINHLLEQRVWRRIDGSWTYKDEVILKAKMLNFMTGVERLWNLLKDSGENKKS